MRNLVWVWLVGQFRRRKTSISAPVRFYSTRGDSLDLAALLCASVLDEATERGRYEKALDNLELMFGESREGSEMQTRQLLAHVISLANTSRAADELRTRADTQLCKEIFEMTIDKSEVTK